jgi:zinc and cadmium transporter
MAGVWLYSILSVFFVSLISLIGVFTLSVDQKKLFRWLIYLVSFSAGTLMGDAFLHLIPEAYGGSDSAGVSFLIIGGILFFFILEKAIRWRHCHEEPCENHPHPFSYVILFGDVIHNFIDGLIIAASFIVSVPVGVATTVAVIFHEIPQEIGDFSSLIYGGFSRARALWYNFLTALSAILGAVLVLFLSFDSENLVKALIPFAAGGFIYIAGTDLIPELHKHTAIRKTVGQIAAFALGVGVMATLLFLE